MNPELVGVPFSAEMGEGVFPDLWRDREQWEKSTEIRLIGMLQKPMSS